MYVQQLRITNTKLIKGLEIDFRRRDGSLRPWTILVGENGTCKTTVLQMLALAAVGPEKANQLAPSLIATLAERGGSAQPEAERGSAAQSEAERGGSAQPNGPTTSAVFRHLMKTDRKLGSPWRVHWPGLIGGERRPGVRSWVEAGRNESVFRGSSEYTRLDDEEPDWQLGVNASDPWRQIRAISKSTDVPSGGWFCAGYGVGRNLPVPNETSFRGDPLLDRLSTLFNPTYQLVATDFINRWPAKIGRHYAKLLKKALVKMDVLPNVSGLELRGQGGITSPASLIEAHRFEQKVGNRSVKLPAVALSHGYQSTIAWVADLVGQVMLDAGEYADQVQIEDMRGLVLVDELDLHLHPSWQQSLVRSLKNAFPRLQFVATTHSPLALAGAASDEVFKMELDSDGYVRCTQIEDLAASMTASGVLARYFGVTSVDPRGNFAQQRTRLDFLESLPSRTSTEEAERNEVRLTLKRAGFLQTLPRGSRGER